VTEASEPRLLILETSTRTGYVAVAHGPALLAARRLDEARRHARDLAPAVSALLAEQGWAARDLQGVIVSRGPGSYTGLRIGMMSAKTLAYATGCALLAIDTFAALAGQSSADVERVDVIADAQQDRVYVQPFVRSSDARVWQAAGELTILPLGEWLIRREVTTHVTGPGLHVYRKRLPASALVLAEDAWDPQVQSLLEIGLRRYRAGERDDVWAAEPLYLRPSAAEQQWQTKA
jgi:tRNA threonylcarbamoyladenosine biosynthesis protein TsaB